MLTNVKTTLYKIIIYLTLFELYQLPTDTHHSTFHMVTNNAEVHCLLLNTLTQKQSNPNILWHFFLRDSSQNQSFLILILEVTATSS